MKITNEIKGWAIFIVLGFVVGGILTALSPKVSIWGAYRALFGAVYVLFLPGYVIVRCFFNDLEDWIEKVGVSFGLSIAVVILATIVANLLLKIPINSVSTFLIILAVILITLIAKAVYENWKSKKADKKPAKKPAKKVKKKVKK